MEVGLAGAARGFRNTALAGLLWLAAIRIAVDPVPDGGADPVWQAVQAIAGVASPTSDILALLVGAYLLGVFSEATLGALSRWYVVRVVKEQTALAKMIPWTHAGTRSSPAEVNTMAEFMSTAVGRSGPIFHPSPEADAASLGRQVRQALLTARHEESPVAREVDRLRAEAELRLFLIAPILAVGAAVAGHGGWWLIGLPGAIALSAVVGASANHAAELANDELADWLCERRERLPNQS